MCLRAGSWQRFRGAWERGAGDRVTWRDGRTCVLVADSVSADDKQVVCALVAFPWGACVRVPVFAPVPVFTGIRFRGTRLRSRYR